MMAESTVAERIRETLTSRPIAIVGLDAMGLAIARRLVAHGLRVVGWDRDADRRSHLQAIGGLAEAASGAADIGHDCDVVLSTLPAAELFAAAFGDADRPGFALELAPGSLIVDMGVAMPSDAQRLASLLGRGGIGVIDAPLVGEARDIDGGSAVVPVGGFGEFIDRLEPLLGLVGEVRRGGTQGRGHALAALIVYWRHGEAEAARTALEAGLACGLTRELLADLSAAAAAGPPADDPRLAIARRLLAEVGDDGLKRHVARR